MSCVSRPVISRAEPHDLDAYLRVVIQRHGAESAVLLYPDDAEAQRLYDDLEDLGFDFLERRTPRLHHIRQFALSQFMRTPTDAQRAFLSQNLSTGYFWTVHVDRSRRRAT